MTNPGTFVPSEAEGLDQGAGLDFDEIASRAAAPDPVAPTPVDTSIKLEGDSIPEEYRGLTLEQMLQRAEGQKEAIKRLGARFGEAPPQPSQPAPVAAPSAPSRPAVPSITMEQFEEMYEQSPTKAVATMAAIVKAQLEEQFDQRLAGITGSVAGTAKHQAQSKYAEEFKVLGPEIEAVASQVPDKNVLARPEAWDSLVTMVKGMHADKWVEHQIAKRTGGGSNGQDPRTRAAEESLSMLPAERPAPAPPGRAAGGKGGYTGQLTEEHREVMKVMGIDEATYRKYYQ